MAKIHEIIYKVTNHPIVHRNKLKNYKYMDINIHIVNTLDFFLPFSSQSFY